MAADRRRGLRTPASAGIPAIASDIGPTIPPCFIRTGSTGKCRALGLSGMRPNDRDAAVADTPTTPRISKWMPTIRTLARNTQIPRYLVPDAETAACAVLGITSKRLGFPSTRASAKTKTDISDVSGQTTTATAACQNRCASRWQGLRWRPARTGPSALLIHPLTANTESHVASESQKTAVTCAGGT